MRRGGRGYPKHKDKADAWESGWQEVLEQK